MNINNKDTDKDISKDADKDEAINKDNYPDIAGPNVDIRMTATSVPDTRNYMYVDTNALRCCICISLH